MKIKKYLTNDYLLWIVNPFNFFSSNAKTYPEYAVLLALVFIITLVSLVFLLLGVVGALVQSSWVVFVTPSLGWFAPIYSFPGIWLGNITYLLIKD